MKCETLMVEGFLSWGGIEENRGIECEVVIFRPCEK